MLKRIMAKFEFNLTLAEHRVDFFYAVTINFPYSAVLSPIMLKILSVIIMADIYTI